MQELGVLLAKCDVSFWKVSLIIAAITALLSLDQSPYTLLALIGIAIRLHFNLHLHRLNGKFIIWLMSTTWPAKSL